MATMPTRSTNIVTGWSIRENSNTISTVVIALYIKLMRSTANSPFDVSTLLNQSKAILPSYTKPWFPSRHAPKSIRDGNPTR